MRRPTRPPPPGPPPRAGAPPPTPPPRARRGPPPAAIHPPPPPRPAPTPPRHGIRVPPPAETLVDLAHELDAHETRRALREAQFLRLFDLDATEAALERRPSKRLSALIADLVLVQTDIEDRLLDLSDRHHLPRPLTQQPVLGHIVDFLWPAEKVIPETDGWAAHGNPDAFQSVPAATNAYQMAGYTVLRST